MINDRVKHVRKEIEKMTLEQFGDRVGISAAACSYIENGKSNPTALTIKSICREFGIREEWLRTGEGDPKVARKKDEALTEFFNAVLADQPDTFRARLITAMSKWTEDDWETLAHLAETLTEGK